MRSVRTWAEFPLHVALTDVRPDGHSTLICQGWVATAHAAGGPLNPGTRAALTVPLYATSYRLTAGHRLRLVMTGADFPLLWPARPNPRLTVFSGGADGTYVLLPVAALDAAEPDFDGLGPPAPPPVTGTALEQAVNRVNRDLDDTTASFEQKEDSSHNLDDRTTVHLRRHNWSTIIKARPEDTVLTARMEADIERDGDPVHILVQTIETADNFHVDARIELAGRPISTAPGTSPSTSDRPAPVRCG